MKKAILALSILAVAGACYASDDEFMDVLTGDDQPIQSTAERYNERLKFMGTDMSMPAIEAEPGSPGDIFKEKPTIIIIKKD